MTNRATITRMTAEILDIAEANGIDTSWRKDLVMRTVNREGRSCGGKKNGFPYMSIALKSTGWMFKPYTKKTLGYLDYLMKSHTPARDKKRYAAPMALVTYGNGAWCEYRAIAKDPEIGDLYGEPDDELKPLAGLLCHELAHVIDYNSGALEIAGRKYGPSGTVHGTKWKAIYRLLRNSYVATDKYKPEVIEFKPRTKPATDERAMDLMGLPLFDLAA